LKERRRSASLSQAALAERLGRPPSVVAEIETTRRRVDLFEFIRIADALAFDPVEALTELVTLIASKAKEGAGFEKGLPNH
jgi:transcriptional regulator with XRE-family HTH domain